MKAKFGFPAVLLLFWAVSSHQSGQVQTKNEVRPTSSQNNTSLQQLIDDTLRLIADGEREITLDDDYKDIVLVVGMTGAGKTTITKFVASMELLESYKAGSRFLIRDNDAKISQISTVVSKTIFPDRIIDNSSNIAFYDMPGFFDTRDKSIELANAWFMKKVADHAQRVKILLIVSHSTLQSGEHRDIILSLLDNVVDFIPDPAKFKDAISMVVSKVQSSRSMIIERISFIHGIATFLRDVRRSLDSVKGQSKIKAKRDLIDALLSQDSHGTYNRIAFFKQPKKAGPLTNVPDMVEQRHFIKSVIENNTVYVEKSPGDFGISVSPEAQSISFNLTQIIANKLSLAITGIQEKIRLHFQLKLVNSSFSSLGKIAQEVEKLQQIPGTLANQTSLQDFLLTFISLLSDLQVKALKADLPEIRSRMENLQFFENVTGVEAPLNFYEWIKPLKVGIQKVTGYFQQKLASFNDYMVEQAENAARALQRIIVNKLSQPEEKDMLNISEEVSSLWAGTRTFVAETFENARKFNEFASRLDDFLASHGLQFDMRVEEDLQIEGADCELTIPLKLVEWLAPFKELQKSLRVESLKLRLQNHKDKNQWDMEDYRSTIALLERNLTSQWGTLKLEAENLTSQIEHEAETWEGKIREHRGSCEREKTSTQAAHSESLKYSRRLHEQGKSDIMEQIRQEQKKSPELRARCKETHDAIRESMKQEGEEQAGRLKSVAVAGDAADKHERYLFNTTLSREIEECERGLQGVDRDCQAKLDSQKATFALEIKRLEQQVAREEINCRRSGEEETARCNQQSTEIAQQNNAEAMRLQSRLDKAGNDCTAAVQANVSTCDAKITSLARTTHQEVQGLHNDLEKAKDECRGDINRATTSETNKYSNHQKIIDQQIVSVMKNCQAIIRESNDKYAAELESYRKMAGA